MREYIGLRASQAVEMATNCNLTVSISVCDSDKLKAWDTEIVVQAKLNGNNLDIVTSKFLMNKD